MDFFEVLTTRKTIRKYKEDIPPVSDIHKIIDAGRLAPSATNSQNWEFIAIYQQEIKKAMFDAVTEMYDEISQLEITDENKNKLNMYKYYSGFFVKAPVVIAIVEKERNSFVTNILKENNYPDDEISLMRPNSSLLSIGAAIENMSLAAHALGYGTCWLCAPIVAYKKFKEILNLDEKSKIVSLLTVGIPEHNNFKSPPKKPLSEVMKILV